MSTYCGYFATGCCERQTASTNYQQRVKDYCLRPSMILIVFVVMNDIGLQNIGIYKDTKTDII